MSQATPVWIILRYREQPFQNLNTIIIAFFKWRDILPLEDYCTHICSNFHSSLLYLVLDLHCKTFPNVNLTKLDLEVYKVTGIDSLYVASISHHVTKLNVSSAFKDLGEEARKKVYQRSVSLEWGGGTPSNPRN